MALRERVFEPAYYDLLAREGGRAHAVPLGLRVLGLVLETWRVGWPGLVVGLWRTRRVRWALAVACGLLFVVFILTSYGYQ